MSRIRSISIGIRLAVAFGVVCAACLIVALVGFKGASGLHTATQDVAADARSQQLLGTIAEDIASTTDSVLRHLYVFDGDLKTQDAIQKEIEERFAETEVAVAEVAKSHPDAAAVLTKDLEALEKAVKDAVATSRTETLPGRREPRRLAQPVRQRRHAGRRGARRGRREGRR
jgi:hypothetical protein